MAEPESVDDDLDEDVTQIRGHPRMVAGQYAPPRFGRSRRLSDRRDDRRGRRGQRPERRRYPRRPLDA